MTFSVYWPLPKFVEIHDLQGVTSRYAPITKEHLNEGKMSVAGLGAAAIQYSDNTAANLLLQSIGGPESFTRYVRTLGDDVTRLDRIEPALNANLPDDPRDTTTPSAILGMMKNF